MAQVTLKGNAMHTAGDLPAVGSQLPGFTLTAGDLSSKSAADFAGKKLVLNIFPSIDTPTCAASVRSFNEKAAGRTDAVVLCISADLPFAQARFCGAEGIDGVENLSTFRSPEFGRDYGIQLVDGPLAGLQARAVVVAGADGKVLYSQLVNEVADEPNYEAALAVL